MVTRFINLLLFILLLTLEISAFDFDWISDFQGKNSGHTTCNFLTLPVSSMVLARGLASSPAALDATDLPIFSASSALSNRNKFAITHLQWFMGLHKEYAGALFSVPDIGTFGCYSQIFSPGEIEHARDINEMPSDPSMIEFAIGTSYARSFFQKKVSMGISASYVESRLDQISGRALAGSFNLLFTPMKQFDSHLYLSNFGTGISYGSTTESLPLQGGVSVRVHPLPIYLPFTSNFNFDIGLGVSKIADEPLTSGVSTGIKLGQFVQIFSGYEHKYKTKSTISGFGLGGSFHYQMYGFEAAWKKLSKEFGSVWSATLKIQLEEKKLRTAEDYYTLAEKFYRLKRKSLCNYYAKKTIQMDPNLWKAHALLNRLYSEDLRNKKQEISFIYTGNIKNQFLPPPYSGSLGGIARQAAIIKKLRNQYPVTFAIQAGNILTASADSLRLLLTEYYLNNVNFDAVSAGPGELAVIDNKKIKTGFPDFICSNEYSPQSPFLPFIISKNNGYKLYVASFINQESVHSTSKYQLSSFNPDKLLAPEASTCDLRVLVFHDTWSNISSYAQYLQSFDIIICGSIDQHFAAPMKIGKTIILSAGDAGKYLGNLIMRFDEHRKLVSIDNYLIPLSSEIAPDSFVNVTIEKISTKIALNENGSAADEVRRESTDGVFPYISNKDGYRSVYLKMIGRNAEYPLTRQFGTSFNPVMSAAAGKVAFICASDNQCNRLELTDLTGAHKNTVQDSIKINDMSFTPDGKWLYFSSASCKERNSGIFRTPSDGGPVYPVVSWTSSNEHSINFSSANEYMVFCSNRDGTEQIYLTNQIAEHTIKITDALANHFKPTFSPDGRYVGYLSDRSNFGGKLDLWIYDRTTGAHSQVTQNSNVKSFCWLSDSKSIIYSSGANLLDLTKVDITTFRFSKLVSSTAIKTFHEKNPIVIKVAGIETIIYEREFENGEKQIFAVRPDGTANRCIVDNGGSDWLIGSGD